MVPYRARPMTKELGQGTRADTPPGEALTFRQSIGWPPVTGTSAPVM